MKKMLMLLMGIIAVSSYDASGMNEEDRFVENSKRLLPSPPLEGLYKLRQGIEQLQERDQELEERNQELEEQNQRLLRRNRRLEQQLLYVQEELRQERLRQQNPQ